MIVRTWGDLLLFGTGTAHRRPKQPTCRVAAKRNEDADRDVVVLSGSAFWSNFSADTIPLARLANQVVD
jgi:hypothetical protein